MNDLWFVLWFFLPAGVANVTPIIVAKLPVLRDWNYPLDCYGTLRGLRILGDHKTWRGLLCGVSVGFLVGYVIYLANRYPCSIFVDSQSECVSVLNESVFEDITYVVLAPVMSFGALIGDAVKSFVKRRLKIPSGKPFLVFDQIDYILGAIVAVIWWSRLTMSQVVYATLLWGGLSLMASYIGFLTKFKKEPI